MYQIGLCDDEEQERQKTQALLAAYQEAHPGCRLWVRSYASFQELLFDLPDSPPLDLLLLDIYMPGTSGMEGAAQLRSRGFESPIVFLTSSTEHALDAYDVSATHYLLKPVEKERFFAVVEKALGEIVAERRRFLALRVDREVRRIALRSIVCCESQNHYQALYLASGEELQVRMTQAELFGAMCQFPDFVRVGSAYIVNLSFVDSLSAKVMKLTTGKDIWLPRGSYHLLKARYFDFYRSGQGGDK